MLLEIFCLSSCKMNSYNYCPIYPLAGKKVAEELTNIDYQHHPHTWDWIGRIDKLRQELELCR